MRAAAALLALTLSARAEAAPAMPKSYAANCQVCHRADGSGLPGQFPRLKGRVGRIAAKPAGRAYLVDLMLGGMAGKVVVDGRTITGVMPGYARLSDADLAATLTYTANLDGSAKSFTPAEVAAGRKRGPHTPGKTKIAREALVAAGVVP